MMSILSSLASMLLVAHTLVGRLPSVGANPIIRPMLLNDSNIRLTTAGLSAYLPCDGGGAQTIVCANSWTSIHLENNQVDTLQSGLFVGLASIAYLGVDNNLLTVIPAGVLSPLVNLEWLNLRHNQISAVEVGAFSSLVALRHLNLDWNRLVGIPTAALSGLVNLEWLGVSNNPMQEIQVGLVSGPGRLTNLTSLIIQDAQLTRLVDGTFNGLSGLRLLLLGANSITAVAPQTFSGLTSLYWLDLSRNQLTAIDEGTLSTQVSLFVLHLYTNRITFIPAQLFATSTALNELVVSYNQITHIADGALSGLSNLLTL